MEKASFCLRLFAASIDFSMHCEDPIGVHQTLNCLPMSWYNSIILFISII